MTYLDPMANPFKTAFLEQIRKKYGKTKQLPNSLSLFDIADSSARIYVRYSKIHDRNRTFFGLRRDDLKQLEGFNSVICFLWDRQAEPVFIPFIDFEEIFSSLTPASDGQYKVQIYPNEETELYIANAGRFNIEGFYGWHILDNLIDKNRIVDMPDLNHSQIQTLIGSIGTIKGHEIWIPFNDRNKLDWNLTEAYVCKSDLPVRYDKVANIIKEVDVVWMQRGSSDLNALFEIEHSTPVYSALLRFNDLFLVDPNVKVKFNIVSNDTRRSIFLRQISRPTFMVSGLGVICNFMEYRDVYSWFKRIKGV